MTIERCKFTCKLKQKKRNLKKTKKHFECFVKICNLSRNRNSTRSLVKSFMPSGLSKLNILLTSGLVNLNTPFLSVDIFLRYVYQYLIYLLYNC